MFLSDQCFFSVHEVVLFYTSVAAAAAVIDFMIGIFFGICLIKIKIIKDMQHMLHFCNLADCILLH
jgi:hypothetical protein